MARAEFKRLMIEKVIALQGQVTKIPQQFR
jgi:hypothetical protein